jgi:hypothetical protein
MRWKFIEVINTKRGFFQNKISGNPLINPGYY